MSIVDDPVGLARLREAWLGLLARSDANEPMLSPQWLEPWWQVFGPLDGRRLCVVTFHERDQLVGLVPLCRRRVSLAPGLRLRRLEALGTGEDEDDEICSDYLGVIAASGRQRAVADAFAGALTGGFAGGVCDELVLPALAADSPTALELTRALQRHGWTAQLEPSPPSPYIALPARFEDYLAALPQQRRYMVRRSLKDFDKWAAGRDVLHEARDAASLDQGMRVLGALHGQRWQAAGRRGAFGSSRFASFHAEASRRMLAHGALELLWLSVGDEPVAALYNLVWNGKVYFYQAGRKMDLPGKLRPGMVLHARAIARAIAAGRREYDFLAGTARYKMDLALATRPLCTLRGARPGWREDVRKLVERGRSEAKQLRERWRARRGTNGASSADERRAGPTDVT